MVSPWGVERAGKRGVRGLLTRQVGGQVSGKIGRLNPEGAPELSGLGFFVERRRASSSGRRVVEKRRKSSGARAMDETYLYLVGQQGADGREKESEALARLGSKTVGSN